MVGRGRAREEGRGLKGEVVWFRFREVSECL